MSTKMKPPDLFYGKLRFNDRIIIVKAGKNKQQLCNLRAYKNNNRPTVGLLTKRVLICFRSMFYSNYRNRIISDFNKYLSL